MKNYFPTILATGEAFCNRKKEIEELSQNIRLCIPTLLLSPRRYGKTSLVLRVLELLKIPNTHVDLYKALNEKEITEYILNGIGRLLGNIESRPVKLMKLATGFFSSFQLRLNFTGYDISVELTKDKPKNIDVLLTALERLDKLVYKHSKSKSAVLFLDEFQVLSEVCKNKAMEAAIREAMQKSKNVRYVFAGSNRHLIERIFNDDSRPFFNSCHQITLNRISENHYVNQINKASKERWKKKFSLDELMRIFEITECHPYYVNKLCSELTKQKTKPNKDTVQQIWDEFKNENNSRIEQEISLLSSNQRHLLIKLAENEAVQNPFGKDFSKLCSLSPTSIHRIMEFLVNHDYVYRDNKNKYRVLDPLIRSVLAD